MGKNYYISRRKIIFGGVIPPIQPLPNPDRQSTQEEIQQFHETLQELFQNQNFWMVLRKEDVEKIIDAHTKFNLWSQHYTLHLNLQYFQSLLAMIKKYRDDIQRFGSGAITYLLNHQQFLR